jgi:MoaA/NifB/PqqE/SkfB family radical SAM enzyme
VSPSQIYFLLSLRCNERCSKCSHWRVREHPPMVAPQLVAEALHAIPSARELCLVGGEPLLHRAGVLALLEAIADLPALRTTIITNGVGCTPAFVDALRGRAVHLVFSIDTVDREAWRWVRGTDSYDRVLGQLEYVRATLRPEQLSVQSVLARETRDHVAAVGAWCAARGITQVVQPYLAEGFDGGWTPLDLKGETAREVAEDWSSRPCQAAGRNLSIMPGGEVFTCFQQREIPGCAEPIGVLGRDAITDMLASPYAAAVQARMERCDLPCKVLTCNR